MRKKGLFGQSALWITVGHGEMSGWEQREKTRRKGSYSVAFLYLTDSLPPGLSDGGISLNEVPFFKVAPAVVELRKTSQHIIVVWFILRQGLS